MARKMELQIRRDTAANWTATNPTLAAGEPGWESDTNKLKFGTGSTAWNALSYFSTGSTSPLTTKGDVWGFSTVDARIPVGSNGQFLQADSTQTLGVKWAAAGGAGAVEYDYVERTSNLTVTATTAATAQAWIDGNAVTYDGATRVKIEAWCELAEFNQQSNELILELYDGATDLGLFAETECYSGNLGGGTIYGQRFLTPSNAAHTFHVKAWKTIAAGAATLYATAGGAGARLPSWYRITKA